MFSLLGRLGPLVGLGVSFVYPLILTMQGTVDLSLRRQAEGKQPSVATGNTKSPPFMELVHFLIYWILFGLWMSIEGHLPSSALQSIPLFYEIKCILFFWLGSAKFKGAGWLWFALLESDVRDFHDQAIEWLQSRLPPPVKDTLTALVVAPTTSLVVTPPPTEKSGSNKTVAEKTAAMDATPPTEEKPDDTDKKAE
eukprot:GHVT01017546.1.p1 GENE.GHVT01017546.1~~GHVT01017546.1.p1  ORF type:complete len:196 (+),score=14.74 GHVT01017546.1:277-864(+)